MLKVELTDGENVLEEKEFLLDSPINDIIKYIIWVKTNILFKSYGNNDKKTIQIEINGVDIFENEKLKDTDLKLATDIIQSLSNIDYMMECNKQVLTSILEEYNDKESYVLEKLKHLLEDKNDWDDSDLKFYNDCYTLAQKKDTNVSIAMYNLIKQYVEI